jgi:DNA polymerase I
MGAEISQVNRPGVPVTHTSVAAGRLGLPFKQVWALDFEYISESGALPVPVCMVANELVSGRSIRLWQDDFGDTPPFRTDPDVLFVAF